MSKLEELKELYQTKIIPHSKAPYHFEKKADATQTIKAYNPLCGDQFEIYVTLEDETIKTIYFHGFGCAISKASTSILIQKAEGMKISDFLSFVNHFLEQLNKEETRDLNDVELNVLNEIKNFNGRMDCVKLSWSALFENIT